MHCDVVEIFPETLGDECVPVTEYFSSREKCEEQEIPFDVHVTKFLSRRNIRDIKEISAGSCMQCSTGVKQ